MKNSNYQVGDVVLAGGKALKITKVDDEGNIYDGNNIFAQDGLILLSGSILRACGFHERDGFFVVTFPNNNMVKVESDGCRWKVLVFLYPHFGAIAEHTIDSLVCLQHILREELSAELEVDTDKVTDAVKWE